MSKKSGRKNRDMRRCTGCRGCLPDPDGCSSPLDADPPRKNLLRMERSGVARVDADLLSAEADRAGKSVEEPPTLLLPKPAGRSSRVTDTDRPNLERAVWVGAGGGALSSAGAVSPAGEVAAAAGVALAVVLLMADAVSASVASGGAGAGVSPRKALDGHDLVRTLSTAGASRPGLRWDGSIS